MGGGSSRPGYASKHCQEIRSTPFLSGQFFEISLEHPRRSRYSKGSRLLGGTCQAGFLAQRLGEVLSKTPRLGVVGRRCQPGLEGP